MYCASYGSCNGTVPYGQGMTTIPGVNDDWNGTSTDGNEPWCDGAFWQYVNPETGKITVYFCLSSTPGAAIWQALITQS